MSLHVLEWDSQFLGFAVARLSRDTPQTNVVDFLKIAKSQGVRLVYWGTSLDAVQAKECLSLAPFQIVEQATFKKSIASDSKFSDSLPTGFSIVPWENPSSDVELSSLAIEAGHMSRFRLDTHFAPNVCPDLYRIWIERSCRREIADAVFTIRSPENSLAGMVTLSLSNENCSVGLIAVAAGYQRRGLGRVLMQISERFAARNGCSEISVVTQVGNQSAARLYESCGFTVTQRVRWFHFWLDADDVEAPFL